MAIRHQTTLDTPGVWTVFVIKNAKGACLHPCIMPQIRPAVHITCNNGMVFCTICRCPMCGSVQSWGCEYGCFSQSGCVIPTFFFLHWECCIFMCILLRPYSPHLPYALHRHPDADSTRLSIRSDHESQYAFKELPERTHEFIWKNTPEQDDHVKSFHTTLKRVFLAAGF